MEAEEKASMHQHKIKCVFVGPREGEHEGEEVVDQENVSIFWPYMGKERVCCVQLNFFFFLYNRVILYLLLLFLDRLQLPIRLHHRLQ